MQWTEEKLEQFKNLLRDIPSEDVALMTARVWCKEFNLKFDDNDGLIARRWHRFFHEGSLDASNSLNIIQAKDKRGNWMNIKDMSTQGKSIWTCVYRDNSFLKFKNNCYKMMKSYVDALKKNGYEARVLKT